MVAIEKFGINNAYSIAKILLSCGVIEENDLIETVDKIINGTFQPRVLNEKNEKESKTKKSSKKIAIS